LKVRRWIPALLWAGVILFVTSVPTGIVPQQLSPYDKVVHFTMYGLFAVLLSRDIARVTEPRWRAAVLAIAIATAFGAADEWHQRFIPGRSSELGDWRADSIGAAIGGAAFALSSLFRRSRITPTR
jgi:VanZ family protein